jgi:glycosyltransferase involved in cell wall biosynthesis
MRIGIDARELCGRPTGVGRYLHGLLAAWAVSEATAGHEFVLYAHETPTARPEARRFMTRVVPGHAGVWWEQLTLGAAVARDHVDVFFSPSYTTPLLLDVPTVVAIHDVSFFAHPEWFRLREGLRRRWCTYQSAIRARVVLTISDFSKRELVDRLGLASDRIRVIPPGIETGRVDTDAHRSAHVLFVGSIFNRRHVPDLICAFAPVARAHASARLDIVGDNRSHPREDVLATIAREGLTGRARWRAYVTDDELFALYGGARAFAFLSEYEGLGLTPLEALSWGVPPVLLDTPVARESCGDAALYVPPRDRRAVTDALETLLFDEPTRRRLLEASARVLARFDSRESARKTLNAIEHAA